MTDNKVMLKKEDIITNMSQRKLLGRNRYLINLMLQTEYYCYNYNFEGTPLITTLDPITRNLTDKNEELVRENNLHLKDTLLIDKETKEFLRVDLHDFIEAKFYPLVFNCDDVREIQKYFRNITYFGDCSQEDWEYFQRETLKTIEAEQHPDLRQYYEVVY